VGIGANPATIIGKKLSDNLVANCINIVKVLGHQHGFRGNKSAGIKAGDEKDAAIGITIISLNVTNRNPHSP
jgi:uncharacterized protein YbbC (DUF1343 family)